ncbi:uncharacterized protein LOC124662915 [Lolium rigidum]|uniref:uncharacterized protein LOC124662915 n=1 Tax=Lolium rigidum TaxID=89674 RepID=UPI001F5CF01A|nr:uncharacterized protein LOC124662915 [Lolium rigidum]
MATAYALCSVAVVAWFASIVVMVLSFFIDKGTVQIRVTTSYALVDCAPPLLPSPAARNSSSFRESLLPLLAALPAAAAAAAPRGFASLHSDDHSAFVRGICLGFDHTSSCHACLVAAAENLTSSCLGASRRGGAWRSESCFVAYADTNTSSAREDAFRVLGISHVVVSTSVYPGGDPNCFDTRKLVALARSMARRRAAKVLGAHVFRDAAALARRSVAAAQDTVRVFPDVARGDTRVRVLAQCARDRAGAAECARCLGDAARQVPPCSWGLDGAHVRVADVVGYSCFLRVETLVKPQPVATWRSHFLDMATNVLVALEVFATVLAAVASVCDFIAEHSLIRGSGEAGALV